MSNDSILVPDRDGGYMKPAALAARQCGSHPRLKSLWSQISLSVKPTKHCNHSCRIDLYEEKVNGLVFPFTRTFTHWWQRLLIISHQLTRSNLGFEPAIFWFLDAPLCLLSYSRPTEVQVRESLWTKASAKCPKCKCSQHKLKRFCQVLFYNIKCFVSNLCLNDEYFQVFKKGGWRYIITPDAEVHLRSF